MPLPEKPEEIGNAGRPAAQTPQSGAAVATLEPQAMHAISVLKADHREIEALLGSLAATRDPVLRGDLMERLLDAIHVHLKIEEELFYPAVERAIPPDHEVRHVRHEHGDIREELARVEQAEGDERSAPRAVAGLEACVAQHFVEEEHVLFPRLASVEMDWTALGVALAARREDLRAHGRMRPRAR